MKEGEEIFSLYIFFYFAFLLNFDFDWEEFFAVKIIFKIIEFKVVD